MTKRIFALMLAVLLAVSCFALTACGGEKKGEENKEDPKTPVETTPETDKPVEVKAPSIMLAVAELEVEAGKTVSLNALITNYEKVEYLTSDATIATVENGTITGVAAGTATITVKATNGDKVTEKTATVTVKPAVVLTDPNDIYVDQIRTANENYFYTGSWWNANIEGTTFNTENLTGTTGAPFEVWGSEPHLQFLFVLNTSEKNMSVGYEDPTTYAFFFDVYYKPIDDDAASFKKVTIQAWSVYMPDSGANIYRCCYYEAGMNDLVEGQEYECVIVGREGDEYIGYFDSTFTFTDSAAAYQRYALEHSEVIK